MYVVEVLSRSPVPYHLITKAEFPKYTVELLQSQKPTKVKLNASSVTTLTYDQLYIVRL